MSGYTAEFTCDRENVQMEETEAPWPVPPGWMTTDEVAAMAQCSADTVIRAIKSGKIVHTKVTGGGTWLINYREGEKWAKGYKPYATLRKAVDP